MCVGRRRATMHAVRLPHYFTVARSCSRAVLGHCRGRTILVGACHGWHSTARPPPSAMLAGEHALVSRRPNLGYLWVWVNVRNMMVPGVSPETSPTVSYRRSTSVPYLYFTVEQAPLTAGPICQSVCSLVFLFFHIFEYMFQKFIFGARSVQIE